MLPTGAYLGCPDRPAVRHGDDLHVATVIGVFTVSSRTGSTAVYVTLIINAEPL